jgi:hypothetical protein
MAQVSKKTAGMKKPRVESRTVTAKRMLAKAGAGGTKGRVSRTKTTRVDQRIYDAVFGAVMGHRLPPGTKLTEASLCELFHVSRTIVRKALLRLSH